MISVSHFSIYFNTVNRVPRDDLRLYGTTIVLFSVPNRSEVHCGSLEVTTMRVRTRKSLPQSRPGFDVVLYLLHYHTLKAPIQYSPERRGSQESVDDTPVGHGTVSCMSVGVLSGYTTPRSLQSGQPLSRRSGSARKPTHVDTSSGVHC